VFDVASNNDSTTQRDPQLGRGPSLRAIAREAGVSLSTVSLALNQKPKVSSEMRYRVSETLRRMGYPLHAAQAAGPVRQPRIGIVYSRRVVEQGALNPLGHDWIDSIRRRLEEDWARVTIFAGCAHIDDDAAFRAIAENGEIEGVILIGSLLGSDGYVDYVERSGIPLVLMNRRPPKDERISGIVIDNRAAGRQAGRYLIDKGHRAIAVLVGNRALDADRDILTGIEATLHAEGLEATHYEEAGELEGRKGEIDDEDIRDICQRVRDSGATAVFAWWDTIAARMIDHWQTIGVRVPEDISVLGHNYLDPRLSNGKHLSSVFFDRRKMGRSAAELLLALIEQDDFISHQLIVVKTHIVERDTVINREESA